MPDIHFTRVDLPAPLSPIRAVPCPAGTSRSQSCSACTGPKFFDIPRRLNRGVAVDAEAPEPTGPSRPSPDVEGLVDSGAFSISDYLFDAVRRAVSREGGLG